MNNTIPQNVTSFRKKGVDVKSIPGTRISTHNAQLLTSIGLSTMDFFLGGGLPIGTICVIEEDLHDIVSKNVMKYFLSEGVIHNHQIYISSGGKTSSKALINELPAPRTIDLKHKSKGKPQNSEELMKIAIQYQNQSPIQDAQLKSTYHNQGFDLSKQMSEEQIKQSNITTLDPMELSETPEKMPLFILSPYSHLLEDIKDKIISGGFKIPTKNCATVMRIGLISIGSPLWHKTNGCYQELEIVRFLFLLKAMLRTSFAVALITIPFYIKQNKSLMSRIIQTCDTVVNFESFEGTKFSEHLAFQDYAGLVHLTKLPVLNSCIYPTKTTDLAYKIKRKELIIERLHLPPDFDDKPEESAVGCGGSSCSNKLDF